MKKNYSVLIVDDNTEWCEVLRKEIEQYEAFAVAEPIHEGKAAFAYIEEHKPDVILLDLVMPVYDGLYVIEQIRKMDSYRPYIYVLSAIGTDKTNRVMRNLDVNYYSVKPIDTKAVAYNLHKLILDEREYHSLLSVHPPLINFENRVDEYLHELGAPLYLLSTKCTRVALCMCLQDEAKLNKVTNLYIYVAEELGAPSTPASIERNIRSTVNNIQKANNAYYKKCFPYGHKKLGNADFLNKSIYLLKRRIDEFYEEQVVLLKSGKGPELR